MPEAPLQAQPREKAKATGQRRGGALWWPRRELRAAAKGSAGVAGLLIQRPSPTAEDTGLHFPAFLALSHAGWRLLRVVVLEPQGGDWSDGWVDGERDEWRKGWMTDWLVGWLTY